MNSLRNSNVARNVVRSCKQISDTHLPGRIGGVRSDILQFLCADFAKFAATAILKRFSREYSNLRTVH